MTVMSQLLLIGVTQLVLVEVVHANVCVPLSQANIGHFKP